jgi:hypothetical protein
MLAASGTPLIRCHLNLQLVRYDESSGRENEIPTTLFIQYKHTGELLYAAQIRVSAMNAVVDSLSLTP